MGFMPVMSGQAQREQAQAEFIQQTGSPDLFSGSSGTVDQATVMNANFDATAGTSGLSARGLKSALVDDSFMGTASRFLWNHPYLTSSLPIIGPLNAISAGLNDIQGQPRVQANLGRTLSPEEATATYGMEGLKFDKPINEVTARYLQMLHQEDSQHNAIMSMAPGGVWNGTLNFGVGVAASFTDPVQLALNVVPPLRVGKIAMAIRGEAGWSSILGNGMQYVGKSFGERTLIRAGEAATTGALTGAVTGGMEWGLARQEQRDYSMTDILSDMATGGVMYGAFHVGGGFLSDLFDSPANFRPKFAPVKGTTVPGVAFMTPETFGHLSETGGRANEAWSLNDHVIDLEMQQDRILSQDERIEIMEANVGQPIPEERNAAVQAEKVRRSESLQRAGESEFARMRSQVEIATGSAPKEGLALANATTPDAILKATEMETNAAEKVLMDYEANRPQMLLNSARTQTAGWNDVPVTLHQSRAGFEKAFPSEAGKPVNGIYDPATGVHVITEDIKSPIELADILRHEGAHIGFARLFGDGQAQYEKIAGDVYDSLVKKGHGSTLDKISKTYGFEDKGRIIEEYMARAAEISPDSTVIGEFLTHLKMMLSKVIPAAAKWSNKDIAGLISMARRQLETGNGNPASEIQRSLNINPAKEIPVLKPRREIRDITQARASAEALAGHPIINADTGMTGSISKNSISKMVSESAVKKSASPEVHAVAVANIDQLFEGAILGKSHLDKNADVNVASIHRFYAPFTVDGKTYAAKMTVKELIHPKANRIYSVESLEIETPARNWVASIADHGQPTSTPHAGATIKVANLSPEFKGEIKQSLDMDESIPELSLEEELSTLNQAVNTATSRDEQFKALQAKRHAILNRITQNRIDEHLSRFADPYEGVQAYLVGTNKLRTGARNSVARRQSALEVQYQGAVFVKLTKANLWREYSSKACERDIMREMWRIGQPAEIMDSLPKGADPKFEQIAKIVDSVRRDLVGRANRAGASIHNLPGYIFRQSHDMTKVRSAGFQAWHDTIEPKLDWAVIESQNSFDGAPLDRESFLKGAFDGISSGVHLQDGAPLGPSGRSMSSNQANKLSASRKLYFKSADDFAEYNDAFGTGSLKESVFKGLSHLSSSTALMEMLGPNPELMFQKNLDRIAMDRRMEGRRDTTRLQNIFGVISGQDRIPGNVTGARIGSAVRAVANMSRLGQVLLSSLPDSGTAFAELRYQGVPALMAMDNMLTTAFRNTLNKDSEVLAASLGAGLESMLGDVLKRQDAFASGTDALHNVQQFFFKATGLGWWTDSQQRGTARTMSAWLGLNKDNNFADLAPETQRILGQFELGDKHWDAMRKLTSVEADGRHYVLPQHAQEIPDIELKALKDSENFSGSLASYRDELHSRFMNFFTDRVDYATIKPGAFERSLLMMGTRPGTWIGEGTRSLMMFKSFSLGMVTKCLGREIYGKEGTMEKIAGVASLAAICTAFGYASLQLSQLSQGKTFLPPNWKTLQAARAKGGGLGIIGDYLLRQNDPNRNVLADSAGPVIGTAASLYEMGTKFKDGGEANARDIQTIRGLIPFNNLVGVKNIIDYQVIYKLQEALNPGYLERMERTLKSNTGQEYMIPPSKSVR